MTNHTSGPWIVSTIEGDLDTLMIGGGPNGGEFVAHVFNDWPLATVEANARLIAAAPSLLATLKQSLIFIDSMQHYPKCFSENGGADTYRAVKNAIEKAVN